MFQLYARQRAIPVFLGLLLLMTVGFPDVCVADDANEARQKFMLGMELVEAENYEDALAAFEASYAIVPKASVLYNIGMCQKALFRYTDAIGSFTRFLDEVGSLARADMVEAVERSLRQLDHLVVRISLSGAPDGARVELDGAEAGTTPLAEPLVRDPGSYTLRVIKDGLEPFESRLTLASGAHKTVQVALGPAASSPPESSGPADEGAASAAKIFSPLFVTGIALGAAGLAGVGVGAYFTVRHSQHNDDLDAAGNSYTNAPDEATAETFWEEYQHLQDDEIPRDRAGMIAGYVAGGALLATGAVLVVLSLTRRNKKENRVVSVVPTPGGLAVSF